MTGNHPPAAAPPPAAAARRIRVLPGSTLSLPTPPPPPSHPPPQPVHLYKIAVIGDALSGKSSLVDKFLIRKSAARRTTTTSSCLAADNDNNSLNGGGGGGIHWCNASATSQGTFGTVQSTTTTSTNFFTSSASSLATYSKKDIALTKSSNSSNSSSSRRYETTCVRAQVWDVNVPQSAIIENIDNNYSSCKNETNDVSNKNDSTSSVASSMQQQQYNHSENSISPLLLPLLNRINGIILTCPCPSPPSFSSSSNIPTTQHQETDNTTTDDCSKSINSISNNGVKSNNVHTHNGNSNGTWQELELLEVQIAKWMNFIHGHVGGLNGTRGDVSNNNNNNNNSGNNNHSHSNNNNHPYKIFLMLTFADLAITHYSPNEWMQLSLKLEQLCGKFGICSWRMGTCVDNSSGSDATFMDNLNKPQDHQWQRQQRQYNGLLEQMARQQQQMMEEMEDSVEGLFIDMILLHLDG